MNERVLILLGIILGSFLLRCLMMLIADARILRKSCLILTGTEPVEYNFAKHFRLVGWDIANAAMGLFIAALTSGTSQFSVLHKNAGIYGHLVTLGCFSVIIGLYILAILTRFVLCETAEFSKTRRTICSLIGYTIGGLILGAAAKLT